MSARTRDTGARGKPLPTWARLFRDRDAVTQPRSLPAPPPAALITGRFYRHTHPDHDALALVQPAPAAGRYHDKGGPAPLYCSSSVQSAWGELFRHCEPMVSPFEVRRRMSEVDVREIRVLDLTDPDIQTALGVTRRRLVSNRVATCRRLARFVAQWPHEFDGILAPSASVQGMTTLVVFPSAFPRVTVKRHIRARPPVRLVYLFEQVIGSLPPPIQDVLYAHAREARQELHRRARRGRR